MMCRHTVVLPEPSGPNTSTMRPRGIPPIPRAMSSAMEPVGITETPCPAGCSPRRMTAPFPNCRSICDSVTSSILSRSIPGTSSSHRVPSPDRLRRPSFAVLIPGATLAVGSDINYTPVVRLAIPMDFGTPYSNTCSRSSTLAELRLQQRLVPRTAGRQVAPVQHQAVHQEGLRGDVRLQQVRDELRQPPGRQQAGQREV